MIKSWWLYDLYCHSGIIFYEVIKQVIVNKVVLGLAFITSYIKNVLLLVHTLKYVPL